MLPRLYILRHGETEWSISGRHTGRTDLPLTPHGEAEARETALRLRDIPFTHVLTSPSLRARQTCELAGLGPVAVIDSDLQEWDYGTYEGLHTAGICETRPGWSLFHDGCPDGESPHQISERADRVLVRVRAWEGRVALFTHGQFGRVLAARWIGLPAQEAEHFLFGTGSMGVLDYEHHQLASPVIALWNVGGITSPV
jgi:probable phosphoglycerate mutase